MLVQVDIIPLVLLVTDEERENTFGGLFTQTCGMPDQVQISPCQMTELLSGVVTDRDSTTVRAACVEDLHCQYKVFGKLDRVSFLLIMVGPENLKIDQKWSNCKIKLSKESHKYNSTPTGIFTIALNEREKATRP